MTKSLNRRHTMRKRSSIKLEALYSPNWVPTVDGWVVCSIPLLGSGMPSEDCDCVSHAVHLFSDPLHMRSAWAVVVSPENNIEATHPLERLGSGCCTRPSHGAQSIDTSD